MLAAPSAMKKLRPSPPEPAVPYCHWSNVTSRPRLDADALVYTAPPLRLPVASVSCRYPVEALADGDPTRRAQTPSDDEVDAGATVARGRQPSPSARHEPSVTVEPVNDSETRAEPVAVVATGSALVSESFTGSTVTDGSWRALGDGCLPRATVAPASTSSSLGVCALRVGSPSANASTGYLQLTDATGSHKGGAVYTKASASNLGLDVTFDQWQYGTAGSGGDGLSFFIADGAASITSTGGQGSSLGYAQNTNQPPAPNGIAGAYLGIGLDAHGAFASSGDGHGTGCAAGQSAALQANSVVLRGPGSGKSGYCFLASTNLPTASQKLHVTVSDPSVVTPAMARKFRVTVSPDRFPTVTVYAAFSPGADLKQVLQYTMTDAAPATYQFGFTASSGSVVDTHLIGNVSASTVAPVDTTPPVVM